MGLLSAAAQRISLGLSLLLLFCLLPGVALAQESGQGSRDEVRAVIVVERHGVRAPIASEIRDDAYNAQPWPSWPVKAGVLTPHGTQALHLLGSYYRLRYAALLQGSSCEHSGIYVEANSLQRTIASAKAFLGGFDPACHVEVHSRILKAGENNPLFMPAVGAAVDRERLASAIEGRMSGHPDWFTNAFAVPLAKMHRILTDCSGQNCSKGKRDLREAPAEVSAIPGEDLVRVQSPVSVGADFAENFLLQYTEGLPMSEVGWGRVSRGDLDQLMEMNTRFHDFVLRTPYFAQISASDLAGRIRDTLDSVAAGKSVGSPLGTAQDRFVLLAGHDSNLSWLGGLLRLDWLLPDQTFNATPPGSALVFELHRDRKSGASSVRAYFISQTLDQIRNLSPLTGNERPSIAPIFIPGCSGSAPKYACSLKDFDRVVSAAIDSRFVEAATN